MVPTPKPYHERSLNNLLYLHRVLTERDMPVPVDLIAALTERGVVLDA
jgi:hypothetical protein